MEDIRHRIEIKGYSRSSPIMVETINARVSTATAPGTQAGRCSRNHTHHTMTQAPRRSGRDDAVLHHDIRVRTQNLAPGSNNDENAVDGTSKRKMEPIHTYTGSERSNRVRLKATMASKR